MQSPDDDPVGSDGPAKRESPVRPPFMSGIAAPASKERPPWSVRGLRAAIALATLIFVCANAWAARDLPGLRRSLRADLAEEAPNYENGDVATTVDVALILIVVLVLILALLQLQAARGVERGRRAHRSWLLALLVVSLPVLYISHLLRGDGSVNLTLSIAHGVVILATMLLVLAPTTSQWIRGQFTRAISEHLPVWSGRD